MVFKRLLKTACHSFPLDLRALALFRMSLGCSSLCAVVELVQYRTAFLDANGVCPPEQATGAQFIDLFSAAQGRGGLIVLWLLNLIVLVAFTLGCWTRCSSFIAWLFALSQHHRLGDCADYGGDELQRHLLFWSLFAPLGSVWSVDALIEDDYGSTQSLVAEYTSVPDDSEELSQVVGAACEPAQLTKCQPETSAVPAPALRRRSRRDDEFPRDASPCRGHHEQEEVKDAERLLRPLSAPLCSYLVLLQMASMYAYTAAVKVGTSWKDGSAVMKALQSPQYAKEPVAGWLSDFPLLCYSLTHFTLLIEGYGWYLAFLPSESMREGLRPSCLAVFTSE